MRWGIHHCHDDASLADGDNADNNESRDDCADGHWQRPAHEHLAHHPIPGNRNGVGRSRRAGGERSRAQDRIQP